VGISNSTAGNSPVLSLVVETIDDARGRNVLAGNSAERADKLPDRPKLSFYLKNHHTIEITNSVNIDVRNLLFWHEVARIKTGAIGSDRSKYIAITTGLGIASIELFTQNIGLLATSLLVAGLAGFRLYQKHVGERYLQRLTAADRDAIDLAVEFGYDREIARELLEAAIQTTARTATSKLSRDRSAARLQVLSLS
jgi:Protein of unknown function (DUF3318)